MAAPLSQKEYLKKYLGGSDADKKRKKKKRRDKFLSHSQGMRIVEDSLDIKNVPFGYTEEDDNPTVAEITYEDEKMKAMEEFAENKNWKKIEDQDGKDDDDDDDDDDSDWLQVHHHQSDSNSTPQRAKQGSQSPSRMARKVYGSPPRKIRHDSGSPPMKIRHDSGSPPRKMRHDSGSPPRKMRHDSGSPPRKMRHDSRSPPRKIKHDSGSPPRKGKEDSCSSQQQKVQHDSRTLPQGKFGPKTHMRKHNESYNPGQLAGQGRVKMSSPKRFRHDSGSPPIRRQCHDSASPHERLRRGSNSPQPGRKRHSNGASPPRKRLESDTLNLQSSRRHDSDNSASSSPRRHDSDTSPPRKNKDSQVSTQKKKQETKVSQIRKPATDTKVSPIRRRNDVDLGDSDASSPRKNNRDSEASPLRRRRHNSDPSSPRRKRLGSDSSPPRRRRNDFNASPPRRKRHDSDSSPLRNKGHDTDASPPRRFENSHKGQRMERKMTTREYLSARKHGKLKKDTPEELARKQREAILQRNAEEKHQQWKHGVKQMQDYKQKVADDAHEMGKAFTRTADDVDMNKQLKVVARKEDPMLDYVMKKETKLSNQAMKPVFKGSFPPNRLNIRPGYRWDGVDRSSGFEKRWFEHQNNKRAYAEDAYKWSVSDM